MRASAAIAAVAVLLGGCHAARPAPPHSAAPTAFEGEPTFPFPFVGVAPLFGPAPEPWPPPTWDRTHWLGPGTGVGRPFRLPRGGSIASSGCPFEAVDLPPCPDGLEALAASTVWEHMDELENRVITVVGMLRNYVDATWSWKFLTKRDRAAGNFDVRRLGRTYVGTLELFDIPPWAGGGPYTPPDPRFICYGDETGVCCGVRSDRRVVARGRFQQEFYRYVYAPLLCDLGEHPVRLLTYEEAALSARRGASHEE